MSVAKQIKWKLLGSGDHAVVTLGCVKLYCFMHVTPNDSERWESYVSFNDRPTTRRIGPVRHSLEKCKDDALRLARELLTDCKVALDAELRRFGLEEE